MQILKKITSFGITFRKFRMMFGVNEKVEIKYKVRNYVYILSCADGTFYTGWTTHLEQRVRVHNQGKGAKYTRSRLPVKLLYWEVYSDKGEALRREAAIKKLTRKQKEELVFGSS